MKTPEKSPSPAGEDPTSRKRFVAPRTGYYIKRPPSSVLRPLVSVLCLLSSVLWLHADVTHYWHYTTTVEYVLSDANLITINTNGTGTNELVLQAQSVYHTTLAEQTNATSWSLVNFGPDQSVRLAGTPGTYNAAGTFTSRIFDRGSAGPWDVLQHRSSSKDFIPEPSLVALYHMDNDNWLDSLTGLYATPTGTVSFSTIAKTGIGSGDFHGPASGDRVVLPNHPLNGKRACTFSFWANLRTINNNSQAGLVLSRWGPSSWMGALQMDDGSLGFAVYATDGIGYVLSAPNSTRSNQWMHIVGCWNADGDGLVYLYTNGVLCVSGGTPRTGSLAAGDFIKFGYDTYWSRSSDGLIDEVAIFGRSLSSGEVAQLYKSYAMLYPLRFQVRSGASTADVQAKTFVGPDMSSDTYYLAEREKLISCADFNVTNQYAQYRAYLFASTNNYLTPYVEAAAFIDRDCNTYVDNVLFDLQRGQYTANTTYIPEDKDTPYLGLALRDNGGYATNGTYTSRILDAGANVNWGAISWDTGKELDSTMPGIVGLWHMNNDAWAPAAGIVGSVPGVPTADSFTPFAKLGSYSAVFNGASSQTDFPLPGPSVRSVEFWVNGENANDGVAEISYGVNTVYVTITNRMVAATGSALTTAPTIIVNGDSQLPKLLSGWNHVVVSFGSALVLNDLVIGRSGTDYFKGMMDELALYSRVISPAEAKAHFVSGRRGVAGRATAQVRSGTTVPLLQASAFGGSIANGGSMAVVGRRYVQYRLTLEGVGDATPALNTITLNYGSGSTFVDDTRDELTQGTFDGGSTGWYGDEIKLDELAPLGPVNLNLSFDGTALGLWHMDETSWPLAGNVVSNAIGASHGAAQNGADTSSGSKIGTRCGGFDGVNDYVLLPGLAFPGDFTVSTWFNSSAATRSPILSSDDGNGYFTIELNGDGAGGTATGKVSFIVDGAGFNGAVTANRSGLNDGRWHSVVAVRNTTQIHLYIDGERAGTANISASLVVGNNAPNVAKRGTAAQYYSGLVDEVAVWNRALSEAEIGQITAGGFRSQGTGDYVSVTITNAGGPAIWQTLFWMADAPYSKPLSGSDASLAALWRFEEAANPVVSLVGGYSGTFNGAGWGGAGRFDRCLNFNGSSDFVTIPHDAADRLNPPAITVEAWVTMDDASSARAIVDKFTATGYLLGTDATGRPYFRVAGTTCTGYLPVRIGKWTHLAGTYESPRLKLYVDGELAGTADVVGLNTRAVVPLIIGRNQALSGYFDGLIDEVAIHSRALGAGELFDHYRAGAVTLKMQGRAAAEPTFSAPVVNFTGPGNDVNTYFTQSSGDDMVGDVALAQYFQYKVYFATENCKLTPRLYGVKVFVSSYPTSHPTVEPTAAAAFTFLGNLMGFNHTKTFNADTEVQYQISGDSGGSPRWFYWNGSQWSQESGFGYGLNTSLRDDINANIGSFFDQVYPKVGGLFRYKAFLHSLGATQIGVDEVDLTAAQGRIVVTAPNGAETGTAAWVSSVPQTITWTSTGVVSGMVNIDLYDQSGVNFVVNLTNTANTGAATLVISATPGTNYRIRIWDPGSPLSIYDMSDGDFWLQEEYHITRPDGGEFWRIGTTEQVKWDAPPGVSPQVDIWFTYDGDNWSNALYASAWTKIAASVPNVVPGNNTYNWIIPSNDWRLVSEKGRMAVVPAGLPGSPLTGWPGGAKRDFSDANFTNAGIVVTYPTLNAGIRSGNMVGIRWTAAGGAPTAVVRLFNGAVWSVLGTNACVPGTNNLFTVQLTGRTTNALIEVTSGGLTGYSDPFTLADINIIAPVGGAEGVRSHWQLGTTNAIRWTSSGAGTNVLVKYTTSELLGIWQTITNRFLNNDSGFVTNSLTWIIPGPPSGTVTVRVESASQADLYAEAGPFSMAGIQITEPLGSETWDLTGLNRVSWLSRDGASAVDIDISFDSGGAFEDITNALAYSQNGSNSDLIAFGAIRRPSDRARLRLRQDHVSLPGVVFTDVMDADFAIRGIAMHTPSNGVVINLGRTATNGLQWFSALTLAGNVQLYYSPDGVTYSGNILRPDGLSFDFPNTDSGTCFNQYNWNVDRSFQPSLQARVKVVAGAYSAVTKSFTMRGIRITSPAAGDRVDIGATKLVTWDYAAVANAAQATSSVSITGTAGPFGTYGFTNLSQLDFGGVDWTVDPTVDPTTNAVIQMQVFLPLIDADVVAMSMPFTLRGIKIASPNTGTNWALGTPVEVNFNSAGMGSGAKASLYYGTNSTDFDLANPITNDWTVVDGLNTIPWNIENSSALTRMPSADAHVMIVCAGYTNISKAFTLNGIKVVTPQFGDVWAVSDGTNDIEWVSVGAAGPYSLSFTVYAGTNAFPYPHTEVIAAGVAATPYPWTMIGNSVGKPVTVLVSGGGFANESAAFEIVPQPSIRIRSPAAGDYWKVTETNVIEWVRGGDMDNNFRVTALFADGTSQQLGSDGAFPISAGVFSYQWKPIPDRLGPAALVVTNLTNPDVWDVFTNFTIAPKFEIDTFTETLYALKDYRFYFTTRGTVTNGADFYYSTDPNRATNSWILINTDGPMTVGNNASLSYNWTVPDQWTATAWLRVQSHAYTNAFPATKPGPYNDYGVFPINYYRVVWYVYDAETTQQLDRLSVVENLGRSYSSVKSPWTNYYPYGSWESVWYREFFHDQPVLAWEPARSSSNVVIMTRAEVEPEYHVMADFAYDISNRLFSINSWLERGGKILESPEQCIVRIYRTDGELIETLTEVAPDANGVFWAEWDVGVTEQRLRDEGRLVGSFSNTEVFFGKVEINYSGVSYSAGLTFALRLAAAEDQVAAIEAIVTQATGQILGGVNAVGSNVLNVASNLSAFRGETLGSLSNLASVGSTTTNLLTGLGTDLQTMTNVLMPSLDFLTNQIMIIGPSVSNLAGSVTNLAGAITNLESDTMSSLARILTRPTTLTFGSTNSILYKTRPEYPNSAVGISVKTEQGAPVSLAGHPTNMVQLGSTGIYAVDLVADWGTNNYIITCADPNARDEMIVKVAGSADLDAVPGMLTALGGQLDQVQSQVTNVASLVSGIEGTDLTSVMEGIDSIQASVQGIQGTDLSQIDLSGVARIESQLGEITDAASEDTFFGKLSAISGQLDTVGDSASDASKKAQTAKTQASSAASGIQSLKTEITKGDLQGALVRLEEIKTSLAEANQNMSEIPKLVRLTGLMEALNRMAGQVQELAASKGWDYLVSLDETPEGEGAGAGGDAIGKLNSNIEEVRNSMKFMKTLMDEMRYEPLVQEELRAAP